MAAFAVSKKEKLLAGSILKKHEIFAKRHESRKLSFAQLTAILTKEEYAFIERIVKVDSRAFGVTHPRHGISSVPKNLVPLRGQKYRAEKEKRIIPLQFLPKKVHTAYQKLNQAMQKDMGRRVLVSSGYRSPAYQAIVFIRNLSEHKWNFKKVVSEVAIPGYSEHGAPAQQALDFLTIDGAPSESRKLSFEKTPEYAWLLKRAKEFGFHLSYPKNNKKGIIFEPWHWSFRGAPTRAAK